MRRAGDRLRITAQLTSAADGYHLWSERYDREMDDVFAVQDDIARAIVERLRVTLARPEAPLVRPGTDNVQAYDLYLRGRYFWARRGEGLQKAIDYFERAIAADPDFAAPYAGLADTYCILGLYGYMPSTIVQGRTRHAAERALALDSGLGEAHYSAGLYEWNFGWNLERAEREFRRAIELNARSALPHVWLAMLALALGRREEGLELARRARALDPLSPLVNALAGLALSFAGSLDEALGVAERAVELEPTFPGSYWSLGWVRAQRGELPGAISATRAGSGVLRPEPPPGQYVGHDLCTGRSRGRRSGTRLTGCWARCPCLPTSAWPVIRGGWRSSSGTGSEPWRPPRRARGRGHD